MPTLVGKINGVIEVNKINNKVSYNEEYTKKAQQDTLL